MKKVIVAVTVLALAGACLQTATAGDREWATVGKILTGVAVASVIAHTIDSRPVNYSGTHYFYAPSPCASTRVVYVPAPVVCCPQTVYARSHSYPRENFGFGHGRLNRGHGHCR